AGFTPQEPQQLVDDRAQVELLGGDQRKAFAEVEAHLPAEHAAGAGAGAVGLFGAVFEDVAEEVEVLAHGCCSVLCRVALVAAVAAPTAERWAGLRVQAAASGCVGRATASTGRSAPAACSTPGPSSASRMQGSRCGRRVRARTRPGSGSCRRAA